MILQHFFAWANYGDVFDPVAMAREDIQIFDMEVTLSEANLPTATLIIANPGIGLLNPTYAGGKRWAYIAYLNPLTSIVTPIFFGRLVSVPVDLLGPVVKILLRAEPPDLLTQKQSIAQNTLMVLPGWDPVFIETGRRLDPDAALEGYSQVWCIDALTATVTTSDIAVGEDGTIDFTSVAFWKSLKVNVEKAPKTSVYIDADIRWTQYDVGRLDLGSSVLNWNSLPNVPNPANNSTQLNALNPPQIGTSVSGGGATVNSAGATATFGFLNQAPIPGTPNVYVGFAGQAMIGGWPKLGTSLGPGYTCWYGYALDVAGVGGAPDVEAHFEWKNAEKTHVEGDVMSVSEEAKSPSCPAGAVSQVTESYSVGATIFAGNPFGGSSGTLPDLSSSDQLTAVSYVAYISIPYWIVSTVLTANYEAKRERSENVRMTLAADLQPVFTDPGGVAANFALDAEYLNLHGDVGLEIPFGNFVGDWQPFTFYPLFSIVQVTIDGNILCFQVMQEIWSLEIFDPQVVGSAWLIGNTYLPGQDVINPGTHETFQVNALITARTGRVTGFEIDANALPQFTQLPDDHSGSPIYKELSNFRGNWVTGQVYASGDIFLAPGGVIWLKVSVGHTATTYALFNTDPTGRLLYVLLVNPPAIGYLGNRWYFPQARGLSSLQHLILRARALLLAKARVFKVTFQCSLDYAVSMGISLRKNATVSDRRLPGGTVTGKITSFKFKAAGGSRYAEITLLAIPGNGSTTTVVTGTPTYGNPAYMGADYQVYSGSMTALTTVGDISYSTPEPDPTIDDGIVFPLTAKQAIYEQQFIMQSTNVVLAQELGFLGAIPRMSNIQSSGPSGGYLTALTNLEDIYELILNPIQNGPFSAEFDVTLSKLSMPKQVDLAGAVQPPN